MSLTSQEQPTAIYPMKMTTMPARDGRGVSSPETATVEFAANQICGIASEVGLTQREVQLLRVLSLQNAQVIAEKDLVETAWGWEYEETDIFRMAVYFRHMRETLREHNLPLDLRRGHWRGNLVYRLVPREPEKV